MRRKKRKMMTVRFLLIMILFYIVACNTNQSPKLTTEKQSCFYLSKKVNSKFKNSRHSSVFSIIDEDSILHSIKLLGELYIKEIKYTLFTDFKKIPVTNGYRGQSLLVALNDKSCKYYRFELPNELPLKLDNDTLFFGNDKYANNTLYLNELKSIVCFPAGCYEQQSCCNN